VTYIPSFKHSIIIINSGLFYTVMNFISNNSLLRVILCFLSLLTTCQSLFDNQNPVYVNHYFARQLFRYFNESNISYECRKVAHFVKDHENEDWALKRKFAFIYPLILGYSVLPNSSQTITI